MRLAEPGAEFARLTSGPGAELRAGLSRLNSIGRIGSSAIVLIVLLAVSLVIDSDGSLGTDTGGKIATVVAMDERGDWKPTLGYWAEAVDPDGIAHPFFGTSRREVGWVNVTTLPMIMVTKPLIGLLGTHGLLVFPLVGSLLVCLAAGELGRAVGANSWRIGFWAAATSSPIAVYGLDFWEHSMGLALMLAGTLGVLKVGTTSGRIPWWAGAAGLSFGLAATMRTEALVFGFIAGLVCLAAPAPPLRRLGRGAAMAGAALVPLVANQLLEAAVYGDALRSERAATALEGSASVSLGQRLQEGIVITASPISLVHPLSIAIAFLVVVALVWMALAQLTGGELRRPNVLVGVLILFLFLRLVTFGPTFVPGMFAALPAAALGVAVAYTKRAWTILVLALGPIPLVWATQYPGAAEAQWGGRYILTSGLLLTVFGVVAAARTSPRLVTGFLAANLVLTGVGLSYLVVRTNQFGEANRTVASVDGVVVFTESFLAREAAPLSWDRTWLSARTEEQRRVVVDILDAEGTDRFTLIAHPHEGFPDYPGFTAEPTSGELTYGSITMTQATYVRDSD